MRHSNVALYINFTFTRGMEKVLIMNILIMEYSTASYCFLPLWHKYLAQYTFLHTSVYNLFKNYTIVTDIVYILLY